MTGAEHPLIEAVRPLAAAIGAVIVDPSDRKEPDISLVWEGEVVGAVRLDLNRTIAGMIQQAEAELGAPLSELSREMKQYAIGLLDARGAFILRKSVDHVADAMGISRITFYAYLNSTRDSAASDLVATRAADESL